MRAGANGRGAQGGDEFFAAESVPQAAGSRDGRLDRLADLENLTAAWVQWYNDERLMHRLGRRPPAEAEADYYARTRDDQPVDHT